MPLPKSSPVSARATDVYSEVCPLVVRLLRHKDRHYDSDMPSLLAYLRQLLTCCACAGLLEDAMISLSCGHCYCYKCQFNQPILKILCRQCKERAGLEVETKLRIIVKLYIELMNLLHKVYEPTGEEFDPINEMIKERVQGVKVSRSVLLIKPPDRYTNVKQTTPKKDNVAHAPSSSDNRTKSTKRQIDVDTPSDTQPKKKPGRKPKKKPVVYEESTTEEECIPSECDDANDPDYSAGGETETDCNDDETPSFSSSVKLSGVLTVSDDHPVDTRVATSVFSRRQQPTHLTRKTSKLLHGIAAGSRVVSLPVSLPAPSCGPAHRKPVPRKPGRPPLKSSRKPSMLSRKIQLSRKILAQQNLLPRKRPGRPLSRPMQLTQTIEDSSVMSQPIIVPHPQPIVVPHPQPVMCVGSPLICEEPKESDQQVIVKEFNNASLFQDSTVGDDFACSLYAPTAEETNGRTMYGPTLVGVPAPPPSFPKKRGRKKKLSICRLSPEELEALKMKPKFRCRCGTNPGVLFGHLICAKRKCPCYLNDIPCVRCRCRGCCNPYNNS